MRKTILAAGLSMLVVLTLAACNKKDQANATDNTAANVSAAPTNSSDVSAAPTNTSGASAAPTDSSAAPPGRGDPTRQ